MEVIGLNTQEAYDIGYDTEGTTAPAVEEQ